jgi:large subunit ribosomal protein L7/L12
MSECQTIEVSEKLGKIIEGIEQLTVLELADLVKILEKKFGVSAAAPVMMAGAVTGGGAAAPAPVVEKTEFDVVLKSSGDKKIQVIKVVRELTGLGLKEAKDLVDGVPKTVKAGIKKEEADSIKAKLEEAGAQAEIK